MSTAPLLTVRRWIRAPAQRLFDAWTDPLQLMRWWGPRGVVCDNAEVDLRIGGRYRIANRFADGHVVWIAGVFEVIEPPHRLVYSWFVDDQQGVGERVTVRFEPHDAGTEVIVEHERIGDAQARRSHEVGWIGCLDGLESAMV